MGDLALGGVRGEALDVDGLGGVWGDRDEMGEAGGDLA